jgi:phage tail-like protein
MARTQPYPVCNFLVDCGTPTNGFAEVDGLSTEIDTVDYREGAFKTDSPIKVASISKVTDITLRRGVVADTSLYSWFDAQRSGVDSPRDVTVTLLDEAQNPVMRWRLFKCRPKRIPWSKLGAKSGDIAIEEFVLSCERLDLDTSA